ncbi:MAG: hypothetical protein ACRDYZ_06630 [Acidimicrobiales bacterium]
MDGDGPERDPSPEGAQDEVDAEDTAGTPADGVSDETAARAMAGDKGAERAVEEAWDDAEPMEGEAPTG